MFSTLALMFLAGLAGSAHCVGMCGGFSASIGALQPRWHDLLPRQLLYTLGRIFTYAFLGAAAAIAGERLASLPIPWFAAQRLLALITGAVMILIALHSLGWLRLPFASSSVGSLFAPLFRHALNGRGWRGALLAGVFTGFLPCGLLYAFIAFVANSRDPLVAVAGMAAFGIGTSPALLAVGMGGAIAGAHRRFQLLRVAACFMLLLGAVTLYRGAISPADCHDAAASSPCDLCPKP